MFSSRCLRAQGNRLLESAMIPSKSFWLDFRKTGGLRHKVHQWGTGQDAGRFLLFFHANSLCAGCWSPIIHRLSGVSVALAFDLRGHGDSDAPDGICNYLWSNIGEDFLRIVEAATKHVGRAPDACITHSFSGDCALMALSQKTLRIGRLILLDPVLADADGATTGGLELARRTRRLREREAFGFRTAEEITMRLEKALKPMLARESLDRHAKDAFARFACFEDGSGRWHLKCNREHEAAIYENRVPVADYLLDKYVRADVRILFASWRRAKAEDQLAVFARDFSVAERVLQRCHKGLVRHVQEVGHFLILEAPDEVAAAVQAELC